MAKIKYVIIDAGRMGVPTAFLFGELSGVEHLEVAQRVCAHPLWTESEYKGAGFCHFNVHTELFEVYGRSNSMQLEAHSQDAHIINRQFGLLT